MVLDKCEGCGEDLEDGVVHDCPVLGTTIVAEITTGTWMERRIRLLEWVLAFEARVVEAQASLETDSKYIGKSSKEYLRASVERMRSLAVGGIEYNTNSDPSREYRSLYHSRLNHEGNSWGCSDCLNEGIR